jgi:hypothetical protein
MTSAEIKPWLDYWHFAKMVAFDHIQAFENVYQARKYCQCMRVGLFEDVSDLQLWNAIKDWREY